MLRLWMTRRWLVGSLIAVVFALACFFLGRWQWGRHVEQRTKVAAIDNNYAAPPVPWASIASSHRALAPEQQWTRVVAKGAFIAGEDLLVRNRTLDQTVGFEVLTPFETDQLTILVDRGWVPNADKAETAPPVDPPPVGPVELTGWLRTGEPSLGRDLPEPQLASISLDDAREEIGRLADGDTYVVLASTTPSATRGAHPITTLPRPDEGLGPHQAYAYQWWLTMPAGLVFVFLAMRRELEAGGAGPRDERAAPTKPKKVRIWDEEDG